LNKKINNLQLNIMKHLFYVHSHITFLICKQYIIDNHINYQDCTFISLRSYCLPQSLIKAGVSTINYPQDVYEGKTTRVFQGFHLKKSYCNLKKLEKVINQHINNQPFAFYIPNTQANDFVNVVVTMNNCSCYYLIEEGSASYTKISQLPKFQSGVSDIIYKWFLRPFLKRFYILRDNMYSTNYYKYVGTIASSSSAFPNYIGQHIIIQNPFEKEFLPFHPEIILSVDPLFFHFDIDYVEIIYQKLSSVLSSFDKRIVYKFHPEFYKRPEILSQYTILLQKVFGTSIFELDQNIIIENILNTYHCNFYSDFSSIGIYGNILNCKCYSYANLAKGYSNLYDEKVSKLPKILRDSYIFL